MQSKVLAGDERLPVSGSSLDVDWAVLQRIPSARGPQAAPDCCSQQGSVRWGRDALTDAPTLSASDTDGDSILGLQTLSTTDGQLVRHYEHTR